MDHHPVGVHDLGQAADIVRVKAVFVLFDETLHFAAFAAKADQIFGGGLIFVTINVHV